MFFLGNHENGGIPPIAAVELEHALAQGKQSTFYLRSDQFALAIGYRIKSFIFTLYLLDY